MAEGLLGSTNPLPRTFDEWMAWIEARRTSARSYLDAHRNQAVATTLPPGVAPAPVAPAVVAPAVAMPAMSHPYGSAPTNPFGQTAQTYTGGGNAGGMPVGVGTGGNIYGSAIPASTVGGGQYGGVAQVTGLNAAPAGWMSGGAGPGGYGGMVVGSAMVGNSDPAASMDGGLTEKDLDSQTYVATD